MDVKKLKKEIYTILARAASPFVPLYRDCNNNTKWEFVEKDISKVIDASITAIEADAQEMCPFVKCPHANKCNHPCDWSQEMRTA